MFETGTAVTLRAFHVMPGAPPPEGERHAHDYRIEIVVGRARLDERQMVVDLDVLDAALSRLAGDLDGADLDDIRPPDAEAVTVELFARYVHEALAPVVATAGAEHLAVRVWESATAFGGYRAAVDGAASTSS